MKALGHYDTALQMFIEVPKEPDQNRLEFLRWLGEQGKLEHPVYARSEAPEVQPSPSYSGRA